MIKKEQKDCSDDPQNFETLACNGGKPNIRRH